MVAGGVKFLAGGMLPTGAQIRSEMQRGVDVMTNARNSSDTLEPAIRPGITGAGELEAYAPVGKTFYRDRLGIPFPGNRIDVGNATIASSAMVPVDIHDATNNGYDKVIRIKALSGDVVWATAYLPSGHHATMSLPPGGYRVFIAEGDTWYGEEEQFRSEGAYYTPQNLDVRSNTRVNVELPPVTNGSALGFVDREEF